ncbi:uncharacterized protein LOC128235137 isoform X2 [Mya arenaria]|uniref:uncharacterized protein LOC128235137 isoform X2 n=1 Tax=Mya arenaria TaxID=6604 RepID=UPI0022E58A3C|nr:uncharacterized protein LOC128235137 isoform X2 [Mya arenaria]
MDAKYGVLYAFAVCFHCSDAALQKNLPEEFGCVGIDKVIPFFESDVAQVSSFVYRVTVSGSSPLSILRYIVTSSSEIILNNFNAAYGSQHDGRIALTNPTSNNSGIYRIEVAYTLASGIAADFTEVTVTISNNPTASLRYEDGTCKFDGGTTENLVLKEEVNGTVKYCCVSGAAAACINGSTGTSYCIEDCKCDCCIHKIVWIVVSIVFSLPSIGWTLFVLKDARRKQWLKNNLGEQAHLCMIGWVVLNLVYSIIAAILFFVLVCKKNCCERECDCVCNCWPIYIIIGYVLKAGDVIVDIIGGIAFEKGCRCCAPCCSWCSGQCTAACYCCDRCRCCAPCCSCCCGIGTTACFCCDRCRCCAPCCLWCCGQCTAACFCCDSDEDDDENPQHGMSNKKRGRTAAASNTVPMSGVHVHATKEPKDAKHKEAMDSHSSGSAVSRNDIYPHLNETASEKPLRQQPLPPVGGQKGHGRGLSANFGDNNDTMPAVDTKRLPPVMDRNEDTEVKKKKKKKKKNKEEREQD